MERMNKRNARNILLKVCDQFHKISGESVGVTYTWTGSLAIFGSPHFRKAIESNKEEIWRSLAFQSKEVTAKKPMLDKELSDLVQGDVDKISSENLRRLISWATKKSTGIVNIIFYRKLLSSTLGSYIYISYYHLG